MTDAGRASSAETRSPDHRFAARLRKAMQEPRNRVLFAAHHESHRNRPVRERELAQLRNEQAAIDVPGTFRQAAVLFELPPASCPESQTQDHLFYSSPTTPIRMGKHQTRRVIASSSSTIIECMEDESTYEIPTKLSTIRPYSQGVIFDFKRRFVLVTIVLLRFLLFTLSSACFTLVLFISCFQLFFKFPPIIAACPAISFQ